MNFPVLPGWQVQPRPWPETVETVLRRLRSLPLVPDTIGEDGLDDWGLERLLLDRAARAAGLSVTPLSPTVRHYQDREGRSFWFHQMIGAHALFVERLMTTRKTLADLRLMVEGLPVPQGKVFTAPEAARRHAETLGWPVTLKPVGGSFAKGVTPMVGPEGFDAAWTCATEAGREVLVQEHLDGPTLRICVVAGRFVAASLRTKPHVVGDGHSRLAALLAAKATRIMANPWARAQPMTPLCELMPGLHPLGVTEALVLPEGHVLMLEPDTPVTHDRSDYDITQHLHPGIARVAEQVATCFPSLDHVTMDLVVPDFTTSPDGQRLGVVDVNSNGMVGMHHFPLYGVARDVAGMKIAALLAAGPPRLTQTRDEAPVWREIRVVGKVRNTGFPAWLRGIATGAGLAGDVKSMADGSMRVRLSGPRARVEAVIARLRTGPPRARVARLEVSALAAPDAFRVLAPEPLNRKDTVSKGPAP